MDDDPHRVASLTEIEKEALRTYLVSSDVKDIARQIDRHPSTVEQRLARARRKLGVRRTLDAAHMLARSEGHPMYGSAIYASSDIDPPPEIPVYGDRPEAGGDAEAWLPVPTKGRPWNTLSIRRRVEWIVAGLLVLTICALLTTDLLEAVSRIARPNSE